MEPTIQPGHARSIAAYSLTIRGELGTEWGSWFGADLLVSGSLQPAHGRTTLRVEVADQAQLLGFLRRIHDLNLTLLSLSRLDSPEPACPGETQPTRTQSDSETQPDERKSL